MKTTAKRTTARTGINRNILECKDVLKDARSALAGVLIETYWNVKTN